MKCQLCKRNKALLTVRVSEGTLEVCVNCAIVLKLEPVEVLSVWKAQEQERLEENGEGGAGLHLPDLREKGDEQDPEHSSQDC